MKWYGLYRDGELIKVIEWYGVPTMKDYAVAELMDATYKIREVVVTELFGVEFP